MCVCSCISHCNIGLNLSSVDDDNRTILIAVLLPLLLVAAILVVLVVIFGIAIYRKRQNMSGPVKLSYEIQDERKVERNGHHSAVQLSN